MKKRKETFSYTYSAKQQEEVKNIRKKYMIKKDSKMEQLRKLDQNATQSATMISIITGIVSSLILGVGMTCTMVWTQYFAMGIVVGVMGLIGVGLAYPLYNFIAKRKREELTPQIMMLSQELLGEADSKK